ncbi:alpha/beta hydrolase [Alloacidobacterium dinghuense]|uniref:Alpha/beta hydrolase n=1 Tax=Alloacidobacterium dinghuense TaxID=2763107 RepID=A0A7G8BPD7_9BACT|nr:alpha/beta hydrolase [Alloacidobacterium dinghuense]QNI34407.1 alpha/beta hydrolase [Alloacidobacterium dinghuense]
MALASWILADDPRVNEISVPVNGHRMYCLTTGNGPSLLLLHGLLGSAHAWYPCLSRLGQDSFVYAVDSFGIGRSDRVPGLDASLRAHADRMATFLDEVGIGRADIMGTSHGGAVAMMLAARHPERVRSLLLHAPANPFSLLGDPMVHFYRTPLGRWFANQVPNLPEKLQELALGRMYGNSKLVRQEALERYMSSLRVPGTVQHVLNILDSWFEDMRELGASLEKLRDVPTLLMWGTRDRAVSLESGRQLEKVLPRAEMVILPGVGHLPHDEAPIAFSDVANAFLRKIDRSEAAHGPQLVRSTL